LVVLGWNEWLIYWCRVLTCYFKYDILYNPNMGFSVSCFCEEKFYAYKKMCPWIFSQFIQSSLWFCLIPSSISSPFSFWYADCSKLYGKVGQGPAPS
jgi:hypothetical protein